MLGGRPCEAGGTGVPPALFPALSELVVNRFSNHAAHTSR